MANPRGDPNNQQNMGIVGHQQFMMDPSGLYGQGQINNQFYTPAGPGQGYDQQQAYA